jgi:hypothetical protein
MNAIEIEEAVSTLALAPFNKEEFPYAFLLAFGNKETTIKRLRSGTSNKSDVGGVLQANNVHITIAEKGAVTKWLATLKNSPATSKGKVRFIVTTDGADFEAEDLDTGETVACAYQDFPDHFGFFLPLAGISTVKQIRESSFDIRATSRLNRLYIELLKDNPEWGAAERRHEMNHLMARLIFCFFAEDTDIFSGERLFTNTVEQMSERDSSNTHQVISEIFRAMDTKIDERPTAKLPRWADAFPYVNGGLFSGGVEVPRLSKISRSYLIHIGNLDWMKINPDIFGSMIQAVADDEERGELGMHYTSVPNILKVLNPLFLDDLRERLDEAGDNPRMLLNLRKRISRIRVFDPACGSGNFLVIAYKQVREIENTINEKRGEAGRASDIPLTNFRGIEIRDFSAEIARLALVIAEYQCDLSYRGQKAALAVFLPLDSENWITSGNALRMDWLSVCPPTATGVKIVSDDLFQTPLDQSEIDFENEGGETYICGNPPYKGSQGQDDQQKADLELVLADRVKNWKTLDYVAGWFMKAAHYALHSECSAAFVSTNSICQGRQVETLWKPLLSMGYSISFAHTSFKWANLASNKAGVTVVVVGITNKPNKTRRLYSINADGEVLMREVQNINAYLVAAENITVGQSSSPMCNLPEMQFGNMSNDGGNLLLTKDEMIELKESAEEHSNLIKRIYGSEELIHDKVRYCLWIDESSKEQALLNPSILQRVNKVKETRLKSNRAATNKLAKFPYRFGEVRQKGNEVVIVIPRVSSENRDYLPVNLLPAGNIITDRNFGLFDAPVWTFSLLVSRLHWVWIDAVCGKLRSDFNYSNTIGWNTFPVSLLTEKNKVDLETCAQDILLARAVHFPSTIADLYDPETMPANLREAHERNDEVLERIYIGRRFRNDTERLEKLFELYTKMTSKSSSNKNKVGIMV